MAVAPAFRAGAEGVAGHSEWAYQSDSQHYQKAVRGVVEPETPVIGQGSRATELQNVTDQPEPQPLLKELSVVSNAGWLAGTGQAASNRADAEVEDHC